MTSELGSFIFIHLNEIASYFFEYSHHSSYSQNPFCARKVSGNLKKILFIDDGIKNGDFKDQGCMSLQKQWIIF
jgi:hypothetical protein